MEKKTLKEWIYVNRWIVVLLGAVTLLAHGAILFTQRFGIDTDAIMLGMYSFEDTGRQGLVWLAELMGLELGRFNLYLAQILTIVFLFLSPVAFGGLFRLVGGRGRGEKAALAVFGISFIVSPFWAAQVYFLNQSAQVLLACTLTAAAIALTEGARKNFRQRWFLLPAAILLMQLTFSSYQVLILIYVTGVAAVFLISSLRECRTLRESLLWILFHAGSFASGLLIYIVISTVFYMSEGGYLAGQILWGEVGLLGGLRNCYSIIRQTMREMPPFYTGWYVVFCLVFLALLLYRLFREKERKPGSRILMLLAALFLAASPYAFNFLYGGEIIDRMRLLMPFGQGCILYLTVLLLGEWKPEGKGFRAVGIRMLILLFAIAVYRDGVKNLSFCTRLYYTDEYVFRHASRVAADVYRDIRAAQLSPEIEALRETSRDNIVLLGYPDIPDNPVCIDGHTIGRSIFEVEVLAGNTLTRDRSRYFMQNLGYPIAISFSEGETAAFYAYFDEYFGAEVDAMPCYPEPGYIKCVSDEETGMEYVAVKLGEDWRLPQWKE